MKRSIRLICLLMICFCMISVAMADHTDLRWGMSSDEVYSILSRDYNLIQNEKVLNKCIQGWADVKIGKYKTNMHAHFQDDKLHAKLFDFGAVYHDADRKTYKNLKASLNKKYGKPLYDTGTWNKKKIESYGDIYTLLDSAFIACPIDEQMESPYYEEFLKYSLQKVKDGKYNALLWEADDQTYVSIMNWDKDLTKDDFFLE